MANKQFHTLRSILPFTFIFGLVLVVVGIGFLCAEPGSVEEYKRCTTHSVRDDPQPSYSLEYTNCEHYESNVSCSQFISENPSKLCTCIVPFELHMDYEGDIVMYYELDYNRSIFAMENYSRSRDNEQLMGILREHPSNDCEPFAYDLSSDGVKRPIAPCGAIADVMFNDTFDVIPLGSSDFVPIVYTALLSEEDKQGFRNPAHGNTSLKIAFQNFTKPKSWVKNIWELSGTSENNGFENEAFIAWMKPEYDRKPLWRVNKSAFGYETGLKKGLYGLHVGYNYPTSLYNGSRRAVLSPRITYSRQLCEDNETFLDPNTFALGLSSLIIGIVLVSLAVGTFVVHRRMKGETQSNNFTSRSAPDNMAVSGATLRLADDDILHIDEDENPFKSNY